MALLYAVSKTAANKEKYGYHDVNYSVERVRSTLGERYLRLHKGRVEALLYCANLMDEAGEFWSPAEPQESFERMVARLLRQSGMEGSHEFDRFYNLIVEKPSKQSADDAK